MEAEFSSRHEVWKKTHPMERRKNAITAGSSMQAKNSNSKPSELEFPACVGTAQKYDGGGHFTLTINSKPFTQTSEAHDLGAHTRSAFNSEGIDSRAFGWKYEL